MLLRLLEVKELSEFKLMHLHLFAIQSIQINLNFLAAKWSILNVFSTFQYKLVSQLSRSIWNDSTFL